MNPARETAHLAHAGFMYGHTFYRATGSIMVLAFRDNQEAAVPIASGTTFDMMGSAEDDRFDVVNVNGEEFLIFDTDLKEFAEPLSA